MVEFNLEKIEFDFEKDEFGVFSHETDITNIIQSYSIIDHISSTKINLLQIIFNYHKNILKTFITVID